ncbi:hypothetical protein SAMN05216276_106424 [Streptosporangium subroseum]|uniref:DUF6542 domain-containing protein n=1 Tax=Streptosporangium subroseum TaxID=106412 RepID=A0A239NQT3_9ACTN|nr:DUF6542 domain-containing protein [Streptosporangium subroseum]SNT56469.1 hypothetical protein SAMN05216276_106424 [Streptosporangium subroseum]
MSERGRSSGIRLTARGAVAFVLAFTLVGSVAQVLSGWPVIGPAFVVGCVVAVSLVNRRDLLSLVVSPPLTFFVATVVTELVRALTTASPIQSFGLGVFTALSGGAPWLFGGSLLVLVIAWRRGLTQCVRELRDELRAAGPKVPRPRTADGDGFAPEPEGYFEPKVYGTPREGQ